MTRIAEIVTFRLTKGQEPAAFIDAAAAMEGFLKETGGMIQRTLSTDDTGQWTDYILWESMDSARRAAQQIGTHPACNDFIQMIDAPTMDMRHAEVRIQME